MRIKINITNNTANRMALAAIEEQIGKVNAEMDALHNLASRLSPVSIELVETTGDALQEMNGGRPLRGTLEECVRNFTEPSEKIVDIEYEEE